MIVAGFGFNSQASAASLADAFEATGRSAQVSVLATAYDKAASAAILDFAKSRNLPVMAVPAQELEAVCTQTQSATSIQERSTGSVAEAAALAAAGIGATLLCHRHISDDRTATCAIAIGLST